MPGIFDIDPQTQGLLQAAFSMLSASGPSRMPVGLGQVLGAGGAAGLAGYSEAAKLQSALAMQKLQQQKLQDELDIQKQIFKATGGDTSKLMTDPDIMEQIGILGTAKGHAGYSGLIGQAEKIRAAKAADEQLKTLQSKMQTIQPDPQEVAQAADLGTPAVQPSIVQSGGLFAPLMSSPMREIASQAGVYQAALNAAPNARGVSPAHWTDLAKQLYEAQRTESNRQENLGFRESLPTIVAGLREPHTIYSAQGIFSVPPGGGAPRPMLGPDGKILMPTAGARIDLSRASQLQRQFNAASKPSIDALGSTSAYRAARETGDTAQAATMAADALRRSARQGNQRFKGEVGNILGSGYGSGSIVERVENFLSQEGWLTGNPSNRTLKKMDDLAGAMERANLEQIARWHKHYAGQATAQGLQVKNVVGAPLVEGSTVVFPEGDMVRFKTPAEAQTKAQQWLEAN